MTELIFISLSVFLQGARGFDGEPGPRGIPGAFVSSFSLTRPHGVFFLKAIINDSFFCYMHVYLQESPTCE